MNTIEKIWDLIINYFNKEQEEAQNTEITQRAIGKDITQIGVQNNYKKCR